MFDLFGYSANYYYIYAHSQQPEMSDYRDNDTFIEVLLQERDELYSQLSRFRKMDHRAFEEAEKKNQYLTQVIQEKDAKIRQLTDQLAWYRRKFWHPSSEKFIPEDPNQRRIDFEGLDEIDGGFATCINGKWMVPGEL